MPVRRRPARAIAVAAVENRRQRLAVCGHAALAAFLVVALAALLL